MRRELKEFCRRGHKFTPENTYIAPKTGLRNCRLCSEYRIKRNHKDYKAMYKKHQPWRIHYSNAYSRTHYAYSKYFKRGIPFDMTLADFKELWFRDKAYLLKKPSIDRIIGELGYIKSNCRFIEMAENRNGSRNGMSKLNEEKVLIIKGMLKEQISNVNIAREFNVTPENISAIAKGKTWKSV